jgi:hypothetical protein
MNRYLVFLLSADAVLLRYSWQPDLTSAFAPIDISALWWLMVQLEDHVNVHDQLSHELCSDDDDLTGSFDFVSVMVSDLKSRRDDLCDHTRGDCSRAVLGCCTM